MKLGLCLIHTVGGNSDRVETLKNMISHDLATEETPARNFFTDLPEHELLFYQVIKNGIPRPSNLNDIDCWKVFYEETKTIYDMKQWAYDRAKSQGCEVVVFIDSLDNFSLVQLDEDLTNLEEEDVITYG